MENSQQSKSVKTNKYKSNAKNIDRLLKDISYDLFTDKELETLIFLTNYIRRIPSDEVENFRIKKYTEAWFIFKRLKDGFSTRTLPEVMVEQLEEYERYEVLAELTKL